MRYQNAEPIGEILKQYIKAFRIDDKLNEIQIVKFWEELMGQAIAQATTQIVLKNRILFVHLNSAVIRGELLMFRDKIIFQLNKKIGATIIDDIVFK